MSSPREAIYDVLQAQRQRAIDGALRHRGVAVEAVSVLEAEWAEYEARNEAAAADYRRQLGREAGR